MKKTAAILLLLIGSGFLLFPISTRMYSEYMQEKLLEEWEPSGQAAAAESSIAAENYRGLDEVFSAGPDNEKADQENKTANKKPPVGQIVSPDKRGQNTQKEIVPSGKKKPQSPSQVIGVLQIKKIGLKIPVLEGATMKNMRKGAGLINGTTLPGQPGNSAIAAHRSRSYGHMFNRLNELEKGDTIIIKDRNRTYTYKVYKKMVVKPTNTSVLNAIPEKRILTLVTCTPIKTATHRLIVQAELIKEGS
ncbi:hypothetical protein DRW41_06555 [Neobacillus piezotolerans]|uniref:Class D sortase n=1 Tax=Neobacillus piezotolerans TaxID=2259171 RepID=A0A3D8GTD1_9BACI|nr:class D sortase [Neobacillus piezotolerans]RDU37501.1 hypothetical protein DRW41_06555 [Neobacillus piezotolerans]